MGPVPADLRSCIRPFHGGDVAFIAASTSVCLRIAGRSNGGHVVGFCSAGNVAHAKACAEAIGEVLRGRQSARYQGVAEFDGHKDRY